MRLASAFAVLACAFIAHASTVANVLSDIADLNADYTNWNAQIISFPNSGGTLAAALDIHTATASIVTDTNTATTDAKNVTPPPIPVPDGIAIVNAFSSLQVIILTTLTNLLAKRSVLSGIPVGDVPALIQSDLSTLNNATQAFEDALIAEASASLQALVSSLVSAVNAAFATAIAAYS